MTTVHYALIFCAFSCPGKSPGNEVRANRPSRCGKFSEFASECRLPENASLVQPYKIKKTNKQTNKQEILKNLQAAEGFRSN